MTHNPELDKHETWIWHTRSWLQSLIVLIHFTFWWKRPCHAWHRHCTEPYYWYTDIIMPGIQETVMTPLTGLTRNCWMFLDTSDGMMVSHPWGVASSACGTLWLLACAAHTCSKSDIYTRGEDCFGNVTFKISVIMCSHGVGGVGGRK